jgi:hypothetical protein
METYFFASWQPIFYDILLLAAAAEFCDRTLKRSTIGWGRHFELRLPVHDLDRWNNNKVNSAVHDALRFLTGDEWFITFYQRRSPELPPSQRLLSFPNNVSAVIPYSDGLDSRAVASLMEIELGDTLVRIRLGSLKSDSKIRSGHPFTHVPYRVVQASKLFSETSNRSRGLKFALLSGLAAFLSGARRIIIPESGQGALGPALVPVGQTYIDYRNHPLFTSRIEILFADLLGYEIKFEYPRLWHTKGETFSEYVDRCEISSSWQSTRSCWQNSRQVSVSGKRRQCGICAACLLRRLSVFSAGLVESNSSYVWADLSSSEFESGATDKFDPKHITSAMKEHAIAGVLHLDHLARLRRSTIDARRLPHNSFQLATVTELSELEIQTRLNRMLTQHEYEWNNFTSDLGTDSFVTKWTGQN